MQRKAKTPHGWKRQMPLSDNRRPYWTWTLAKHELNPGSPHETQATMGLIIIGALRIPPGSPLAHPAWTPPKQFKPGRQCKFAPARVQTDLRGSPLDPLGSPRGSPSKSHKCWARSTFCLAPCSAFKILKKRAGWCSDRSGSLEF